MELTTVTVRTASRIRIGSGDFQEVGVSLSFSVRDEAGSPTDDIVGRAGDALEAAFHRLLRRLDEDPGY